MENWKKFIIFCNLLITITFSTSQAADTTVIETFRKLRFLEFELPIQREVQVELLKSAKTLVAVFGNILIKDEYKIYEMMESVANIRRLQHLNNHRETEAGERHQFLVNAMGTLSVEIPEFSGLELYRYYIGLLPEQLKKFTTNKLMDSNELYGGWGQDYRNFLPLKNFNLNLGMRVRALQQLNEEQQQNSNVSICIDYEFHRGFGPDSVKHLNKLIELKENGKNLETEGRKMFRIYALDTITQLGKTKEDEVEKREKLKKQLNAIKEARLDFERMYIKANLLLQIFEAGSEVCKILRPSEEPEFGLIERFHGNAKKLHARAEKCLRIAGDAITIAQLIRKGHFGVDNKKPNKEKQQEKETDPEKLDSTNTEKEVEKEQQNVNETKAIDKTKSVIEVDRIKIYLDMLVHNWKLPNGVTWEELETGDYETVNKKLFADDDIRVDHRGVILEGDLMQEVGALMGIQEHFKKRELKKKN